MVVPVRIKSDDGFCYIPMLISIKSFAEYQPKKVTDFWEAATEKLNTAGISRALCLCIVFGLNDPTKPAVKEEYALQKTDKIMKELKTGIVKKEIRVPSDDVFGVSAAFADMLPSAQVNADIFASHAFLKAHGADTSEMLNAKNSIYSHATKPFHTKHDALRKALATIEINPQDAEASSSD